MKRFQKGDRVFDIRYGWGTINLDNGIYFNVKFNDVYSPFAYTHKDTNKLLSFTEYTLDGYTSEKPKPSWNNIWDDFLESEYNSVVHYLDENFEPPVRKCK